jgi:antitoxin component of MazEF toxin-antitoxin module
MIKLRLKKFGRSLGVTLPNEVLTRLHIAVGQSLFLIETADGAYKLTPDDPSCENKMTTADGIINRYRTTLGSLAE